MAKEIRYTYSGKEVGTLRKLVSDVVVLEESWLSAADKFFAEKGYQAFLKYAKTLLEENIGKSLISGKQVPKFEIQ